MSITTNQSWNLRRCICAVLPAILVFAAGSGVGWAQCETEFLAADGAENDNAGKSVSISGDVVVVGAHMDDDGGRNSGSAYVYRKSGSTWIEEYKLTASDAAPADWFGFSVGVEGDIAVVGAQRSNDNGADSGSAYVFRKSNLSWVEEQELHASDGFILDMFGGSVAISGDTIVVGAHNEGNTLTENGHGAAYVFRFNGATWVQEQKLVALDAAPVDWFGTSVAVSGDVVVVGAHFDDDNGNSSGSAYVFRRTGSTWVQEQKLLASNGAAADLFGYSVAVYGDLAVVGAYQDDDNGVNFGSAYVFRFNGSTWIEETELYGSDSATNERFAFSVSVGDDVAVIGAPMDNARGAVYIFRKNGSSWVEEEKLLASDGAISDSLGISVGVSGDEIVAGASGNWDNVWGAGSAYIFALPCGGCGDCDDGDACTTDACDAGKCAHSPINCDDGNVCTTDTCDTADGCITDGTGITVVCDDGDACTTSDVCQGDAAGTCAGTALDCDDDVSCTVDICANGVCDHDPAGCDCLDDIDCDDGTVCTDDSCSNGTCQNTNNTAFCNDGDACTTNDVCSGGTCSGTLIDCNDGNPCTDDSCSNGTCQNTNNTNACNDGDSCTTNDVCSGGLCSGTPIDCNDGNACTNDSCTNGTCQNTNNTAFCSDGDACTTGDRCAGGICNGTLIDCNDGNACTNDSCDSASGCLFDPIICLAGEMCVDGICQPTAQCSIHSECDDFDACTWDVCSNGTCSNLTISCNDGSPCTADSCDPASGCLYDPIRCDDGDPCTTDTCVGGVCKSAFPACGLADGCCAADCDASKDPDCESVCSPFGARCTTHSECCSGKCGGTRGTLTCNKVRRRESRGRK